MENLKKIVSKSQHSSTYVYICLHFEAPTDVGSSVVTGVDGPDCNSGEVRGGTSNFMILNLNVNY